MIQLLHGDNVQASRNELEQIKQKNQGKEIITINGLKTNLTEIIQALESKSLFDNNRLIIIESLFSNRKKIEIQNILEKSINQDLIMWEGKELEKGGLGKLPKNTVIKIFKYDKILFKFLEVIYPGNQKNMLLLFEELAKKEAVELIFFMIVRQFRNLLVVKDENNSKQLGFSPWQEARLTNQARYFTIEQLLNNYNKLLEIDIAQKTGKSSFNLKKDIELFLLNL